MLISSIGPSLCSGETFASFHLSGKQLELILLLQMNVMSSAICFAASFRSLAPILSVPVALLTSMLDKYFKTFSLLIVGITNDVSLEILLEQNSLSLS